MKRVKRAIAARAAAGYRWADRKFAPVDAFLNRHTWILPFVTVAIAVVIFFVNLGTVSDVRTLQSNAHDANIAACESGNQAAVGNLANLRGDVRNLKDERADLIESRDLVLALAEDRIDAERFVRRKNRRIRHKTSAIQGKREAIGVLIASRAQFAIKPRSVVKDCEAAYAQ